MSLAKWKELITAIKEEMPDLNIDGPGDTDVNNMQEYCNWLETHQDLLRARDTLIVWKNLAKATNLPGPNLGNLNTHQAVIEKSIGFTDWFNANQNMLSEFKELYCLESLQLTSLPKEICDLRQLQELHLWDNQLTTLPKEIGNLTQLQVLFAHENLLTSLPEEIGQLTQLLVLNLNCNQLTSLPKQIGNLTLLKALYLSDNPLTSLPREIDNLTQLEQLYIDGNLSKI